MAAAFYRVLRIVRNRTRMDIEQLLHQYANICLLSAMLYHSWLLQPFLLLLLSEHASVKARMCLKWCKYIDLQHLFCSLSMLRFIIGPKLAGELISQHDWVMTGVIVLRSQAAIYILVFSPVYMELPRKLKLANSIRALLLSAFHLRMWISTEHWRCLIRQNGVLYIVYIFIFL